MNIRLLVLATFVLAAAVPLAWQQAASNAPPAKLWAAQTGPKEITLVWTRVQGGVRYRIYEATGGDAKLVGQTMASGEQYVRPVSAYGIAHRFAIEVVFENGEVSARAPFNPVVPQEARPGAVTAPASVKAAPSGAGTISITWDGVPGATAYRIARQIVPGGFQILCRLCPTDTTYVDNTANGGARHMYTVATVAAAGASRPTRSNEIVATGGSAPAAARPPAMDIAPPKGTIHVTPAPGSCLSLGEQGNVLVRLADGSVRFFERVHYGRNMRVVENPGFKPVSGVVNAAAVATSGPHSLLLINDGTILAWGRNTRGQLGDPAVRELLSEVPVAVRGITNAVAVAAGSEHSVALLADGTIRVWGSGDRGIPGDGRDHVRTNRVAPATAADGSGRAVDALERRREAFEQRDRALRRENWLQSRDLFDLGGLLPAAA